MPDDVSFNRAWIFLSIGDAGGCHGPVDRDTLLRLADSDNHSLPTDAMLDEAIVSLIGAGLVARGGEDVGLTEQGCAAFLSANDHYGHLGHIKRMFALADEWAQTGAG